MIPLRPKRRDSRREAFVEEYGPLCAEVEAIPATDLRLMVESAIQHHIPEGEWERLQAIEREERDSVHEALARFSRAG